MYEPNFTFSYAEYAPLKPKKREGKEGMADAIFLASKQRLELLLFCLFLYQHCRIMTLWSLLSLVSSNSRIES